MKHCVKVGIGLIEPTLALADENEVRMQWRGDVGTNLAGKACVYVVIRCVLFSFSSRTFLAVERGTPAFHGGGL
jgi:hypothetical protein